MRKLLASFLIVSLLSSTAVMAQQSQPDGQESSDKQKHDKKEQDKQKQAAKQQAAQQRAAQQQANRQANQQRTAERKATRQADQQANQERAAQQQANRQANQQRAAQKRAEQQRLAQKQAAQRADQQRTAQENLPQQRPETQASRQYWSRGDRLPEQYRQDRYTVNNWQYYGLQAPPHGYRWHRDDHNNFYLVVIATGIISAPLLWEDRDRRWNESYHHTYGYDDDIYYRECRTGPDPAGVLAGALIGALLGNTVAEHDRTEATIAGIIIGGAAGAAFTSHMDCEDRSYAYHAYSDGFNDGRVDYDYGWQNPHNHHQGSFRVNRYYYDGNGFRCADFRQTLDYLGPNDRDRNGQACLQPNGAWVVVR